MLKTLYGIVRDSWGEATTQRRLRQLGYAPLLTLSMAFMFARIVLMARILSVREFGEYSEILLISSTFCMLACLGLQTMLQRDMPVMLVRNRQRVAVIALAQCIVVGCGCFLLLAFTSIFVSVSTSGIERPLAMAGLFHGLSQQLFMIVTVESRSRGQSVRYSIQNLIRGFLVLGAGVFLALWTKSALCVIVGEATLSFAITHTILIRIYRSVALRASAAYAAAIRRLPQLRWPAALALLMVTTIGFALLNTDRWIAARSLKPEQFSQYAFAWTLLSVAQSIQFVFNASAFPYLARTFASSGVASTYRLCMKMSCVLLVCGAVLIIPTWLLCKLGILHWFPAYRNAITLIPLFILVATLRMADFWSSFMIIVGLERKLIVMNVATIIVSFTLWINFARPWSSGILGLWEIGVLAGLLSACNYLLVAGAAWRAQRI